MSVFDLSSKIQLKEILQDQSDESTYDDVLRDLAFYRLVRRGLRSLSGPRLTNDEMRERVKTWEV